MEPTAILVIFAVGVVVGILSGLVGIGGGVLIVPFLYFFYDRPELFGVVVSPGVREVVAHGTSLFIIVPTSLRGALAYHRAGLVEWRAVWPIGLASVVSAVAGSQLALLLPPDVLRVAFGVLLVITGARLALSRKGAASDAPPREPNVSLPVTVPTGIAVGLFSALLGVGGGIVAIPLLLHLVHLDVRRVAATSIGIIAITATAGTISYMVSGLGEAGLPPYSLGYVHLGAGLAMFVGSVLSVRWGALLNQRLRPRTLALVFAAVFVLLGARLVLNNVGSLLASTAAAAPAVAAR